MKGFDELDGQALAQLFEFLNGQALEQQNRPRYNRVNNYQGTNYQILRRMQNAIGCLSPSEWEMRDLQYSNEARNYKVVSKALVHLREASRLLQER